MKKVGKLFRSVLLSVILASAICTTPVYAQENNTVTIESQVKETTWSVAGNVTRSPKTFHLGTMYVSSNSKLYFFIPKNNNKDLVQGTVNMVPMTSGGGTSTSFSFANYATEYPVVEFGSLKPGAYMIIVDAYAVGTSQSGTIFYHK